MQEYFISIAIEASSVQAAIWTLENEAVSVIASSHSAFWEDDETLISSCDECLSFCITSLPREAKEPSKTVFGVPAYWVTDGQIERSYLDKVRLICNKLSLKPTGFVTLPEAIAHFQKFQEKTPVNAVLIGVYPQSLDISLFKIGNLAGSVSVARSAEIGDDVIEGLARFHEQDNFPSRFLLYNSQLKDLEDAKQSLMKVDFLGQKDNLKFLHAPSIEVLKNEDLIAAVSLAGASEIGKASSFVEEKKEKENDLKMEGVVSAASMGFTAYNDKSDDLEPIHRKVNLPKLPTKFFHENLVFALVVITFFILVGGFVFYWFVPKAQVDIFVSPKKIDAKEKVTFDAKGNVLGISSSKVSLKQVDTSVSGDKTKTTTGTKVIGTPSRGSVTFYNVGDATTISAGTVLSASGLNFTLDGDVSIASASGAASAATAKGNITSQGVGADYNLSSGTFFSVANFSSSLLQAKSDSDLSGGSSQEVTAVSADDQNSLLTDLKSQLVRNGNDQLKSKVPIGYVIVDGLTTATTSSSVFDNQIGDQATTLKLSLTLNVTGYAVSRDDMNQIAKNILSPQVSGGYVIKDDQLDFILQSDNVDFMANLLPQVDLSSISSQILGGNFAYAKSVFSKIPGYEDASIRVTPNLFFLQSLPHVPKNISIGLGVK